MILYIEYTNYIIKNNKYYREIKREKVLKESSGEGNGNSLQYSCLENSMDRGVWWALVHRVTESDTTEQLSVHTHACTHTHRAETVMFIKYSLCSSCNETGAMCLVLTNELGTKVTCTTYNHPMNALFPTDGGCMLRRITRWANFPHPGSLRF